MKAKTFSIISLFLIGYVNTINILGIFPYQGKSHFFQFKVYLRELANRGHNVTVISYFPDKDPPASYRDVIIGETKILQDDVPVHKSYLTIIANGILLAYYGRDNCEALVESDSVHDLVRSKPKFDVVVVEQFNTDCALGIAHKLGAPVVGMSSHVLMPYHYNRLGIPGNPAFVPSHFLEGGTNPTLYQKLERLFFDMYFGLLYKYVQWADRNTLMTKYGEIPPLEDLAREIKFLLINQHHILTGSRLHPPNVIEVGGYHVSKAKPLDGELKKFMDEAEHGVIYISFGSMIKSSTIPSSKQKALLETISELPQRFIWRWDEPASNFDKNKIYVSNWLPQVDILAHPKTLAFVSHAGMGGVTEAIHYGVPVVAIPIFGDQPSNALAVEESGLGFHLNFNDLDKESLVASLRKVLDSKFQKQAKEVSRAWHDRPMSPLDTAIYWTEYAARNSNFTFRTAAADKPLYQHLNLDVAAVFIVIIILVIYLFRILIRRRASKAESKEVKKGKKRSKKE